MIKIPLTTNPNQTFVCSVPINDKNILLQFDLWYNQVAKYWQMTLTDRTNKKEVFANLPLLASKSYEIGNILCQLEYKYVGISYVFPVIYTKASAPDDTNLGDGFIMVWGDNNV